MHGAINLIFVRPLHLSHFMQSKTLVIPKLWCLHATQKLFSELRVSPTSVEARSWSSHVTTADDPQQVSFQAGFNTRGTMILVQGFRICVFFPASYWGCYRGSASSAVSIVLEHAGSWHLWEVQDGALPFFRHELDFFCGVAFPKPSQDQNDSRLLVC